MINAIKYYKDAYNSTTIPNEKIIQLYMLAISEYYNNQIDTSKVHFNQVIKYYEKYFIKDRYNIAWVLYQYFQSEGNTIKAREYLTDAYITQMQTYVRSILKVSRLRNYKMTELISQTKTLRVSE